jgi:nickel-dependent lactate racemase
MKNRIPDNLSPETTKTPEKLSHDDIKTRILKAYKEFNLRNKKLLVIIPDNTRSAPVDVFFKIFFELLGKDTKKLDYLIALGTHPVLNKEEKLKRVGISEQEKTQIYSSVKIMNHRWDKKETFKVIGTIESDEMYSLSGGLLREKADISLNRIIFEYDALIILGPVFPHEVAGFSGSNKYLFPGICGWNFTDNTHWLAALRTNLKTIGIKDTPVRRLIDRAAEFVSVPIIYFNLVVDSEGLKGLFIGSDSDAWSRAADLSASVNIKYVAKPYKKVLSIASKKYDDLWTGAKAFYKIEPAVEDGGEIIVYAPHIDQFSITHGKIIEQIGFHIKDYFIEDMGTFDRYPKAVLAHVTQVKGTGQLLNNIEKPRIKVILATSISKTRCDASNIDYMNPDLINIAEWEKRVDDGTAVVHNSGEALYRVK